MTTGDNGKRCLVLGYDRSDSARQAANWAAKELPSDGKLVIVHACRALHAPPSPLSSSRARLQLARVIFDELFLEGEDALLDIDIQTEISDEDPVSALVEAAERHHAHAIVVGCEQHSHLHKALGTVTSELLRRSPAPVIAVPSPAGR
jgi:nucleotide-binding universal stress UspA family protein